MQIKFFHISNRICAWDITDNTTNSFYNGGARPFKSASALDKLSASDLHDCPFTRKQLKSFKYIGTYEKMFTEIAPKYTNRNGGYTRIVKIAQRPGDGAMKVLLELV